MKAASKASAVRCDRIIYKPVSQSCAVAKSETFWRATAQSTWRTNGCLQQKLLMFGFHAHTTAIWSMEQSSILSAKFDRPVVRQNCSLFATTHDCETGLYSLDASKLALRCLKYLFVRDGVKDLGDLGRISYWNSDGMSVSHAVGGQS